MASLEKFDPSKEIEMIDLGSQAKEAKPTHAGVMTIRAAAALSLFLAMSKVTGCKDSTAIAEAESALDSAASCSPVVSCPSELHFSPPSANPYKHVGERDVRFGDDKGEIIKRVCEPATRNFCGQNQNPETDSCELPVCESAAAKACDPILGPKSHSEPSRSPAFANFPTSSSEAYLFTSSYRSISGIDGSTPYHRRIFDDVAECQGIETPTRNGPYGDSFLRCDPFPDCPAEQQVDACDNLPRCEADQQPVTCSEENENKFENQEQCNNLWNGVSELFYQRQINLSSALDSAAICNSTSLSMPHIKANCLYIPRCAPGENPVLKTWNIPISCGKYGSGVSTYNGPSCDRVRSCAEPK